MQKKKITREQTLQKLRHYCRYQERCQAEVKNKLFELGVDPSEHEELIAEMVDHKYVDEERFATTFAAGKFRMKQWGRRKIHFALREKQLSEAVIEKGLAHINEGDYQNILKRLAEEKYAALKHEQYLVRKKKTIDYLRYKGFEADLIGPLLETMAK